MAKTAQKRAVKNYRSRLAKRGLVRFEVMAPKTDRGLVKSLAQKLSKSDSGALQLRKDLERALDQTTGTVGGIYRWLRNSPLVGSSIDLERLRDEPRELDL
jgi:hypothetical protein